MNENQTIQFDPQDVADNKVMGVLAYIGILFLVPLLAKKESTYCQFHANQGLLLFIVMVVVNILYVIPVIGWILGFILGIVCLVFAIMGIINAVKGEAKELPIIGKYRLIKY